MKTHAAALMHFANQIIIHKCCPPLSILLTSNEHSKHSYYYMKHTLCNNLVLGTWDCSHLRVAFLLHFCVSSGAALKQGRKLPAVKQHRKRKRIYMEILRAG